ncbi:hypothetical protein Afil01_59030 [Actinorhabdospora filicis]|uniref:Uncharacterized protein n=1 Tax=Actinorhabdospora filicis TaxID=1785913 RepID=A0A9W6WCZ9_9ACTN|nr:hypothetical protein [Actinorhabdospora filicis]GLZ81096.1 hypothetical protein Afil01_59030 [Actinorhabdospora filicis]
MKRAHLVLLAQTHGFGHVRRIHRPVHRGYAEAAGGLAILAGVAGLVLHFNDQRPAAVIAFVVAALPLLWLLLIAPRSKRAQAQAIAVADGGLLIGRGAHAVPWEAITFPVENGRRLFAFTDEDGTPFLVRYEDYTGAATLTRTLESGKPATTPILRRTLITGVFALAVTLVAWAGFGPRERQAPEGSAGSGPGVSYPEHQLSDLNGLCAGGPGLPEAAGYDGDGVHPVYISEKGAPRPSDVPAEWLAGRLGVTQLVACVSGERTAFLKTCRYSGAETRALWGMRWTITMRVARTGELLGVETREYGPETACPVVVFEGADGDVLEAALESTELTLILDEYVRTRAAN